MSTLSGGEKVKAQLMRILFAEPTVLLLDEPSNDIDIETLETLEELILSWDKIVIYISHDETLIERTANKIIHIEQIRRKTKSRFCIANTSYTEYLKNRSSQMENQARQAADERRQKQIRDEKFQRIYQERRTCTSGNYASKSVRWTSPKKRCTLVQVNWTPF